jgi:hypothetical protein
MSKALDIQLELNTWAQEEWNKSNKDKAIKLWNIANKYTKLFFDNWKV